MVYCLAEDGAEYEDEDGDEYYEDGDEDEYVDRGQGDDDSAEYEDDDYDDEADGGKGEAGEEAGLGKDDHDVVGGTGADDVDVAQVAAQAVVRERRAEVRSLSDLPLAKLLRVQTELRRLTGQPPPGEG